ncbi:GIY-YIG nuclease family protein [Candidatus Daviesbacteria bacterium]|nr:GIY-YIG nuclease family protein [Candidatus Daviesbacteria bacterium]
MIFVYIIQSLIDKGYYIGICKNLEKRLEQHNKGGVYSTRKRKPFKIIHYEEYRSYQVAREREKALKSYKGGNSFKQLIK